jgi:hypothetical protein
MGPGLAIEQSANLKGLSNLFAAKLQIEANEGRLSPTRQNMFHLPSGILKMQVRRRFA